MKIAVTGASGYVGAHVVRDLLEAGHEVRATVRDPDNEKKTAFLRALPGGERLTILAADLVTEGSFDAALEGCEGVCHVASPVTFAPKDPMAEVILPAKEGALNLLRSAHRTPGLRRVVLTSSVAAIAGWEGSGRFDESSWNETSTAERSPYPRSKVVAERAAWDFAKEHGLDLVTILPAYVFGPVLARAHVRSSPVFVYRMVRGKMPLYPGLNLPLVDVGAVAQAHRLALETPGAKGRYVLASDNRWLGEIAALIRQRHPELPAPRRQAPRLLLYLLTLFDSQVTLDFWRTALGKVGEFDGSRAVRELGVEYPPWEETILQTVASVRELWGV